MTTHEVVSPLLRSGPARSIDLALTLPQPTDRIIVHNAGLSPGRADAILDGDRVWSAKHHWSEGRGADAITIYEFDESLPAGPMLLRIPV
jgi:hypothetical protein